MGALADLWKSERGLVAIALIAAVTVMFGIGRLDADQWLSFSKWIFVTYAASKTVTGAISMVTGNGTVDPSDTTPKPPNA